MILPLRPNAYAHELTPVLGQLAALMRHLAACRAPTLDEQALLAAVPEVEWLLQRCRPAVERLLSATTEAERRELAEAVDNDLRFDVNVDSRRFKLQYPALPAHVRKPATQLLTAFYEVLRQPGFAVAGQDGASAVFDLRRLEQGYFAANPELRSCPACLEAEIAPGNGEGPAVVECDHYLPLWIYGPLTIHPQNLAFICMMCNQRRKGRRDPLAPGKATSAARVARCTRAGALRESYLPYRRAAVGELKLNFERGGLTLTASTSAARERVSKLDGLLGLTRTWSDVLPRAEREMFEELRGSRPTARTVKGVLDDLVQRGGGPPERLKHGVFVRSRYAAHLRDRHLDVLREEWKRKHAELRRSRELYGR